LRLIEIENENQVLPASDKGFEIQNQIFKCKNQLELVQWLNSLVRCTQPVQQRAPLIPLKNEKRNEIMQMLLDDVRFGIKKTTLTRTESKAKHLPERPRRS
jgi:predicted RNA-binding protein with PUA-like domain